MQERDYYLGFALTNGIGPKRFNSLLTQFKTAKKAWQASASDLQQSGIGNAFVQKFIDFRSKFNCDSYLELLQKANASFIASCDKEYPKLLKDLEALPIVLFQRRQGFIAGSCLGFPSRQCSV